MTGAVEDIRYALRILRKRPAFTMVVVMTLALGIGANSAIFSIVNSFLLRPLPFDEPDELAYVGEYFRGGEHPGVTSWVNFVDFRDQNSVFDDMAAWWPTTANLSDRGEPIRVHAATVSANYFSLLGVRPILGSGFTPDDVIEANRVVVLSESLWRSRFGADPEVIGSSVTLDGESFSVAGVIPSGRRASALDLGERVHLWRAVSSDDLAVYGTVRGARWVRVIARLAPTISVQNAQADFANISNRFAADYPDANGNWDARVVPLHDHLVRENKLSLLVLLGAVALVLLIACANVAALQLSRSAERSQEIATRFALGAGRGRIVRQLLTENVVLSCAGGALGLLVGFWGLKIPQSLSPAGALPLGEVGIDAPVFLFTAVLSIVTGLLFGLAPAVFATSASPAQFLRSGSREVSPSAQRGRLRRGLVAGEIALAVVLLVGAGLLIKSFARLQHVDPGFQAENVLTLELSLPETEYPDPFRRAEFFRELLDLITNIPEVKSAGAVSNLPMASDVGDRGFRIEGRPEPGPDEVQVLDFSRATPDYFSSMGVPLIAGRFFSPGDTETSPLVVIVNRLTAERYWPDSDPIGARIELGESNEETVWRTIVGVVGDVRQLGLDVPTAPQVYLPHAQHASPSMALAIRTTGDPLNLVESVRASVAVVDSAQPIAKIRTMEQVVAEAGAPRRLTILLLATFALVAVALAAVGIYGMIFYWASQRRQEFGLRMALGAESHQIISLVMRQGLAIVAAGLIVGMIGAILVARLAGGLLFEIDPSDPMVLLGVTALVAVVSALSCWWPAHRAIQAEPMNLLRSE